MDIKDLYLLASNRTETSNVDNTQQIEDLRV